VPASVTIILNADGTYYVSFVVNAGEPSPLPPAGVAGVGIDAGIGDNLLHLTASDGTREKIANPRYLRAKERKLKRLSFAHSRKQKGSANREKARIKLARHHRKTTDARLDHHRKLARSIVTNHDVIALETLSLKGMGRTRLSKSVYDAGIGTLYRLITEYAETQGRTVIRIGRWEPTSQTCAVCGTPGGKKPLSIRQWVCTECGTRLDRDYNAALNILVAAGLAETLNACGPSIRRKLASAAGDEAGTHRSDHTLAA
jgi:putative transposase